MTRRIGRRVWLAGSALVAVEAAQLGFGVTLGSGCGGSTSGRRIQIETVLDSDLSAGADITTSLGWTVTVSRAELRLADLYYLEGAPIAQHRAWPWIASAHAHPGHYQEGAVLGEAHGPVSVDLLAGARSLGVNEAVTGLARSATVVFPEGDEPVALIEGTATREGEAERVFRATALAGEVLSTSTQLPEVAGCVLQGGDFSDDGAVEMTIQARLWLDQIDFAELPDNGGVLQPLMSDEPAGQAFLRGVRKSAAYLFSYQTI